MSKHLSDAQLAWLEKNYSTMSNAAVARRLKLSEKALDRIALRMHLTKDKEYISAIRRSAVKVRWSKKKIIRKSKHRNGKYERIARWKIKSAAKRKPRSISNKV